MVSWIQQILISNLKKAHNKEARNDNVFEYCCNINGK